MSRFTWPALVLCAVAAAAPLAAQSPTLERLAFLSGCWEGPNTSLPGSTIEERYTSPSANIVLGTTRYLSAGRTTAFEFSLIRADSAGIMLLPYPDGERSPHAFRLRLAGDTAWFEAPEHDYPKRISYRLDAGGALVARIDAGPEDANPREWRMTPISCQPGIAVPPAVMTAGAPPTRPGADRSGRVLIYVTQTMNGLYLATAVPAMFGSESPTAYGLGLILGPTSGILFAKALNDARPISVGQATAISWGGWWGHWNAIGLSAMSDNISVKSYFRNTTIGLVGGTAVGVFLSRNPISAGDASLVAHASSWGTWYGVVAAVLADANDGWPYVLIGGNGALLTAALATRKVEVASGRVWISTAAGLAGLVAGLGIDILAQTDDGKTAILIPALTSFAGLAAGIIATRNYDRDRAGMDEPRPEPALLVVRDGRLRFGVPAPMPSLVLRDDVASQRQVPGVRLTLFDWRH